MIVKLKLVIKLFKIDEYIMFIENIKIMLFTYHLFFTFVVWHS